MNIETFEGFKIIKYDDGVYGYEMADGKSMKGFKSKIAAKSAAKKLTNASAQPTPQVTPHELTEIEKQLADELSALYDDAAKYLVDKAKNFVSKYQTGKKYDADALNALIKQLTVQIAKTNADAVAAINGYAPIVAAEQANFAEYAIEDGTTLNPSFTLLNQDTVLRLIKDSPAVLPKAKAKIAKNKQWNTPKLRSALTHAIVQGDSIPKLSKKVEEICGSNKAIATRNARTMMTGARNAGTLAAYVRAEQNGMHIQKQWMAALDERTRVSHRHLDGEIKPVNEKFSNGLMHPGDTTGRPAEVWNCRCTMVPIVNDQLYDGKRASKLKDMSYEEWRNAQPKPKSKAKKKKDEKHTAGVQTQSINAIPDNKAKLIAAFEKARDVAIADRSKLPEYRRAVKTLSDGIEFGETFVAQVEKKHILNMQKLLDAAEKTHPEIADMYRAWHSQFSFLDEKNGAFYNPEDRSAHVNLSNFEGSIKFDRAYRTIFHELGHLIDNQIVSPNKRWVYASDDMKRAIRVDWENYRDKIIREQYGSDAVNSWDDVDKNEAAVYYMQKEAATHPGGDVKKSNWNGVPYDAEKWLDVSDIVEGCTGIDYPFGGGHGANYHKSGNTSTEFFAEACSAAIVNEKSYEMMNEVFPNAMRQLLDIIKEAIR